MLLNILRLVRVSPIIQSKLNIITTLCSELFVGHVTEPELAARLNVSIESLWLLTT